MSPSAAKPRTYRLPLSPSCAYACTYCAHAGMRAEAARDLAGVRASVAKALAGPYGAFLVPCNIWNLEWRDEILEILAASGLRVIAQFNAAALEAGESGAILALAERHGLELDFVFSELGEAAAAELERFRGRAGLRATMVVRRRADCLGSLRRAPDWLRALLYFQFPYATAAPGEYHDPRGIHAFIAAAKQEIPGFAVRVPPGLETFDPRIADDRNLEPDFGPSIRCDSAAPAPRISVVIPVYDNRDYLVNVLGHLFRQDLTRDLYEVIVVDDGSGDGTRGEVEAIAAGLAGLANLRYIYFPRKRPRRMGDDQFRAGVARNLGVRHTRGEILFFLDSDILLPPDHLRNLLAEHERYDVVMGKRVQLRREVSTRYTRYEDVRVGPDTYAVDAGYWEAFQSRTRDWMAVERPWRYTCTYALSVSRAAFDGIGWIRRNYIHYGYEDSELGFELFRAGYRFRLSDAQLYHLEHRIDRSEYSNSYRKKKLLLAKSAVTFYHNTLDEGVYRHLDWLFQPLLGARVWLGDFAPFLIPLLTPVYRLYRNADESFARFHAGMVPYPLRKIYYFTAYQVAKLLPRSERA